MNEEDHSPRFEGLKILSKILARLVLTEKSSQTDASQPENISEAEITQVLNSCKKEVTCI
ncbi:MAG: hypothetical protein Q8O10_02405 [candidate division Zixibacteria bacterium]|nr:hypothetical protein [candidate division Zixibacteria bacterium]